MSREYPLEALAGVCERVAVVCKRRTGLPELPGTSLTFPGGVVLTRYETRR